MGAAAQRRWAERGVTRVATPSHSAMSELEVAQVKLAASRREVEELRALLEQTRADLAAAQALIDESGRDAIKTQQRQKAR